MATPADKLKQAAARHSEMTRHVQDEAQRLADEHERQRDQAETPQETEETQ